MEMLKILTHKLKQQSLEEIQQQTQQTTEVDEDRDSGTESDEENAELEALEKAMQEREEDQENAGVPHAFHVAVPVRCLRSPVPTMAKKPLQLVNYPAHPLSAQHTDLTTHSGHSSLQGSSDFERCSLDYDIESSSEFDRHSSEEELSVINCSNRELHPEKRKWSQANRCSSCIDSSGSSDEEVKRLLFEPEPLKFSSSPPRGVHKIRHPVSPRLFLASVAPSYYTGSSVSPRKRHRQTSCRDVSDAVTVMQRPCLDFEKMQVGLLGNALWSIS